MVVVGIRWFQRDMVIVPEYEALSYIMTAIGYYATAALLYGTSYAMIGRIKKEKPPYKNSHPTDWVFLILLFLTTLTGILVHIFIYLQWAMALYVIYIIHLGVAIPMLVLEVPFAKWSHLAYRPVILFLKNVEKAYEERLASVAADHPAEPEEAEAAAEAAN
jgi:nitrate reductase gamma subunit